MKLDINFREEFDEFMNDYGFNVLFLRTGKNIRCRCWNEKYQESDKRCPICAGTGWVGRMEKHRVRYESAVQAISRHNLGQQTEIGRMWVDAQVFYMDHNAHPKVGDYIYEVGWHKNKPTHMINNYRINDIRPLRGDNGRIEFWNVAAKAEPINTDFKNILVRSIGPIKNYEIMY